MADRLAGQFRWRHSHGQSSAAGHVGFAQTAVVLAVVICLLALEAIGATPFSLARNAVFEAYQRQWPPVRPVRQTVVVEIDDESVRRLGQWPWPRDLLAALVNRAQGARTVGVDVLMPDADRLSAAQLVSRFHIDGPALRDALLAAPQPDEALAAALRAVPAVLAMTVGDREDGTPVSLTPVRQQGDFAAARLLQAPHASWPLPLLAEASRTVGIVAASPEATGEIEKLPVVVDVGGTLHPGFAVQLIRLALDAGSIVLQAPYGSLSGVSIDGLTFHLDPTGEVRPRFVGSARLDTLQAYQLLDPMAAQSALQGKIVIIGVTASGVGQAFRTPLGTPESGPAIQAEMIESVLAGDSLWRPFWASFAEHSAGFGLGLAGGLLFGRIRYHTYAACLLAVLLAPAAVSVWAFRRHGILLDWVLPACCPCIAALAASTARIGAEVSARHRHAADLAIERVRRAALEREVELRQEAETLRQSLAFAVDAARLGVWDADLHRGVWHHSPRHDAILGLTAPPPRWSTDILLNRVVPQDRAAAVRSLTEGLASGSLQMECRIRRPDGSLATIHVFGRFWKDAGDLPTRAAGVVVDISRQREMELRLRQGEKMQAVGLLAGGVAHNFNNLLTVVLGSLELAAGKVEATSRLAVLIDNATVAARKSARIVSQLLAFARLQPSNPKPVDTAGLLSETCRMLRNTLPPTVRISLETPSDLGQIRIDTMDFELTLLNLAINARDAMSDTGNLCLRASCQQVCDPRLGLDGFFLVLEVKDDGAGMSPETLANVFEPFFTTKPVGAGTGLGLSQVHGFAHQSGGAVDIESTLGRGTCVRLYLPLTERTARPADARQKEVSS